MDKIKGYRLVVNLGAAATRKRLKNAGYGVRKVQTEGKGRAVIIHTATGDHRRALYALFQDVLVPALEVERELETGNQSPEQ